MANDKEEVRSRSLLPFNFPPLGVISYQDLFFFVVLVCNMPVTNGFDQHFQAAFLFLLSTFFPLKQIQERWESSLGQLGPEAILPTASF